MKRYKPLLLETEEQTHTPEFKKWFGHSKVVNHSGNPLVMYHGSKNTFKVFDLNKTGSATDTGMWGKGFYFSDNKNYSKHYGGVREFYLAIQHPYYIKSKNDIPEIEVPNE